MTPPDTAQVLGDGGWDRRYARVLAIGGTDELAFALVDTNGDEQGVEECFFHRDGDGRWYAGSSSGFASTHVGSHVCWETNGHVVAFGRASGDAPIHLDAATVSLIAEPSGGGWWVAVAHLAGG